MVAASACTFCPSIWLRFSVPYYSSPNQFVCLVFTAYKSPATVGPSLIPSKCPRILFEPAVFWLLLRLHRNVKVVAPATSSSQAFMRTYIIPPTGQAVTVAPAVSGRGGCLHPLEDSSSANKLKQAFGCCGQIHSSRTCGCVVVEERCPLSAELRL